MARRKDWSREEMLAVLYLYVNRKKELVSPQNHPLTEKLARAMRRTNASLAMRIANYIAQDSAHPGRGLIGGGQKVIRIWREYENAPDRLLAEARRAYLNFTDEASVSVERRTAWNKEDTNMDFDFEEAQREIQELGNRVKKLESENEAFKKALAIIYLDALTTLKGFGLHDDDLTDADSS